MKCTLTIVAFTAAFGLAQFAQAAEEMEEYTAPEAEKTVLESRTDLASGADLEARVIKFTLPADHKGGRHYHTGDLFVYVEKGELTVFLESGEKTVKAGEAFYEIPGQTMHAENMSADEEVELIVFQVGKKGEPLMVKAD
ncbi:cupin domain-containing protein [Ferruginivarius sediminum]|uniref:Cupin domain-containing protein n=1 Tax=Ferruginivarius sediminum TaxID=2661937 RepID=A0A369TBQ5_9PROT|nr:cupin domain-containing protein [Ferruginivarius sediminum]RDD62708.1 cupin domain-containing protein [Ferruginivarius sediminum]